MSKHACWASFDAMGKIDQLSVDIPADFRELAEGAVAGGEFSSLEHVVDAAGRRKLAERQK